MISLIQEEEEEESLIIIDIDKVRKKGKGFEDIIVGDVEIR